MYYTSPFSHTDIWSNHTAWQEDHTGKNPSLKSLCLCRTKCRVARAFYFADLSFCCHFYQLGKCAIVVCFTRILKVLWKTLRGGESRKNKWKISRVWDSLSDNSGLYSYYNFPFSKGAILHRGWVLTVTPKPLLSTAGQHCRTGRDYTGFPELFNIQRERQVK